MTGDAQLQPVHLKGCNAYVQTNENPTRCFNPRILRDAIKPIWEPKGDFASIHTSLRTRYVDAAWSDGKGRFQLAHPSRDAIRLKSYEQLGPAASIHASPWDVIYLARREIEESFQPTHPSEMRLFRGDNREPTCASIHASLGMRSSQGRCRNRKAEASTRAPRGGVRYPFGI